MEAVHICAHVSEGGGPAHWLLGEEEIVSFTLLLRLFVNSCLFGLGDMSLLSFFFSMAVNQLSRTSAIIMWQSNVPRPPASFGLSTCFLSFPITGAPNVMFGTKWPSITSKCSQSLFHSIASRHACPSSAKSADNTLGLMIAGGAIIDEGRWSSQ